MLYSHAHMPLQEQEEPPELQSARQQLAKMTGGNDADTAKAAVTAGMQPPRPHGSLGEKDCLPDSALAL